MPEAAVDTSFLRVAQDWRRRGFSVVPVIPGSKLPLMKWRALIDEPLTEDQINTVWAKTPEANVGVIPGSGRALVVDPDLYKGGGVVEAWAEAIMQHGIDVPGAVVAETASGGLHIWMSWPQGVEHVTSAADSLGEGVDIKSSGGYVLVPGSVVDGRPYRWRQGQGIDDCPMLSVAPQSLVDMAGRGAAGARIETEVDSPPATGLAEAYRLTDGREKIMSRAVYAIGKALQEEHGDVEDTQAWFDRAWERFVSQVRTREGRTLAQDGRGPDDLWTKIRSTQAKLRSEMVRVPDQIVEVPDVGPPLPLEFWGEGDDVDPPRDFVEGMLIEDTLSLWFGDSNVGKTFVVFDLACHVALGRDWFGCDVEAGGVVYIAAEGAGSLRKRRKAWQTRYQETDVNLAVIPSAIDFRSAGSDDVDRVIAACQIAAHRMGTPIKLVIVDTLSRAISGGNENAPEDMTAFVQAVDRVRAEVGTHVASIHHSGKDTTKGARGHSSLRAAVDSEFEVVKLSDDVGIIKTAKQRDIEMSDNLGFKLEVVAVGSDRRGREITSCVVVPVEVGPAEAKLNDRQRSIITILGNILNSEGREISRTSIQVDGVVVTARDAVNRDRVRSAFIAEERKTGRGDGEGDAAPTDLEKKAFGRSVKSLEKVRKIVSDQKVMTFYDMVETQ